MKNFMLILSAAVLIITACSKSKTNPTPALTPQNAGIKDVTGKWLATIDTLYSTVNNKITATVSANSNGLFFQFNADGTGTQGVSGNPTVLSFTYSVKGGYIIIHVPLSSTHQAQDISLGILVISSTKLGFSDNQGAGIENIYFVAD